MSIEITQTGLPDLILIKPKIWQDARGYFFESYHQAQWNEKGLNFHFVQENQSLSSRGVLRGLHFQYPPKAQAKLVRVIKGSVLDVVLDIRKGSPTYGQHYSIVLSEQNFLQMYVPIGFAHGFLTLEDNTIFSYKCSDFYAPEIENGVLWNDESLQIAWNIESPLLSLKDTKLPRLSELDSPFTFNHKDIDNNKPKF